MGGSGSHTIYRGYDTIMGGIERVGTSNSRISIRRTFFRKEQGRITPTSLVQYLVYVPQASQLRKSAEDENRKTIFQKH